jgi:aspartate kinase
VLGTTGSPAALLELLDAHQVKGRTMLFDGTRTLTVVPLQDVHAPELLRAKLPAGVEVLDDVGTVTCVGTGLNADWTVARTALAEAKTDLVASYASGLQLTLVVRRAAVEGLTRRLHEALIG